MEILFRGVDAGAPEGEAPVGEGAVVVVDLRVFDDYGPFAEAGFAPGRRMGLVVGERDAKGRGAYQCATDMKVQSS